jgi:hypothetical protein
MGKYSWLATGEMYLSYRQDTVAAATNEKNIMRLNMGRKKGLQFLDTTRLSVVGAFGGVRSMNRISVLEQFPASILLKFAR